MPFLLVPAQSSGFFLPIRMSCSTRKGMDTARKTVHFLLWLLLFPALCHAMDSPEATQPGNPIVWKSPEEGMEAAALSYTMQKGDGGIATFATQSGSFLQNILSSYYSAFVIPGI